MNTSLKNSNFSPFLYYIYTIKYYPHFRTLSLKDKIKGCLLVIQFLKEWDTCDPPFDEAPVGTCISVCLLT